MTEYYQEETPTEGLMGGFDANFNSKSVELRPDYSLDEAERELNNEIWAAWYSIPNGKEFYDHWLSPKNVQRLVDAISAISSYLNVEQLEHAYVALRENNAFEIPPAPPLSEAEQKRANREVWEQQCLDWYQAPNRSTKEIKARVESDPAFAGWVRDHRFDIVLEDASAILPQVLGSEPTGFHPDQLAWQRKEERAQRKKDAKYMQIEREHPGLHLFADEYQRLSATETKKRMRDPEFRRNVEKAAAAGLL